MHASRASIIAVMLLVAFGCRTMAIPEPYVIELPPGMTAQQSEVAVLAGILNVPPPAEYDPATALSDEEFNALIWKGFVIKASGRSWFPESRSGSTIYAAVDTRGLYLQARIEIDPHQLRIGITESRNLSQSDSRIHKRAVKWLRNLEIHIRREVNRMAVFARGAF